MKILQLCNKVPYPEKDGGAISISVFTNELSRSGNQVKMLAMNTTKHFVDINTIPDKFKAACSLETVNIDTDLNALDAIAALFRGKSYNITRFESADYSNKLQSILSAEKFDVVQLEGLYLTPYIPIVRKHSSAPIIMRAHNVEWQIWERLASEERNPIKKIYLSILTRQLKEYESEAVNLCDGIITFTKTDMNLLQSTGCKTPIAHIPFGVDFTGLPTAKESTPGTIFYIGALDWMPNIQALEWFLEEIWPSVNKNLPDVKLHIAGRNMSEGMKATVVPNVVFHGEVEDAYSFMNDYSLMVVPLLAGSGIRVKIIEAMALGKPVITTSVGIEGIECNYGKDVLVHDTPEEFAKSVVYCTQNPGYTKTLAESGRNFVMANHDIRKITENLILFYKERISKKAGRLME